jgi:MYXO-CTERM domain-containing protein
MRSRIFLSVAAMAVACAGATISHAEVTPTRTWTTLVSSNGHGAVVVNLSPSGGDAQIHHFREHIFATEEPQIDAAGNDIFVGGRPQQVFARDLLYDTYFGLRANGNQGWLKSVPVDLDASGFEGTVAGSTGGTGIVRMVQRQGSLDVTQYIFAPWGLEHAAFAMIARVRNTGASAATGVSIFSLQNFHLGFGRPGPQYETGEQYETIVYDGARHSFEERGFAGVVVSRGLGTVSHHGASSAASPPSQNVWQIVQNGGSANIPDLDGAAPTADGSVSVFQSDVGTIGAGQEAWFGVVSAHYGDPFGAATVEGWLDAWVGGRSPQQILDDERGAWATFQAGVSVPSGLTPEQEVLYRQSAVVLRMAQVRESETYLRPYLTNDGDVRRTRFGTTQGGPPAALPAVVQHRGRGAVLASLPPGEWTYAWPRDGAYAIAAMSAAGMKAEARTALEFYLRAEGGRFQSYSELNGYGMPPYRISLTRYHGFGVEETDYNDYGPNLEFDGFGLFLWALRQYTDLTGDSSPRHDWLSEYTTKIADPIVALVDPATGLLRKDSSIWETHWNGRQRAWAYTNITAVRGLCDAAAMAQAEGSSTLATKYAGAAESIRDAIALHLTDPGGVLASNAEELAAGEGYFDAAVLDAVAFGLFDPTGPIASHTIAAIDQRLATSAGVGWSRNDDNWDHQGATDWSPWGSSYDSAEWVFTDMRGAVARRLHGDTAGADRLIEWVRRQATVNYLEVAETYDESSGAYKFNAPMVGFGAGAWILAASHAKAVYTVEPACGAYYPESGSDGGTGGTGGSGGGGGGSAGDGGAAGSETGGTAGSATGGEAGVGGAAGSDSDAAAGGTGGGSGATTYVPPASDDSGCGCEMPGYEGSEAGVWGLALGVVAWVFGRRRRRV